jgi:hypothetical protein
MFRNTRRASFSGGSSTFSVLAVGVRPTLVMNTAIVTTPA